MEPPDGVKLGSTHGGVVADSQTRIYASTDGDSSIIVFDQDGKFVPCHRQRVEAGQGTATARTDMPNCISEGRQEFIYLVSLFRNEFAKITTGGEVVWVKGYRNNRASTKTRPNSSRRESPSRRMAILYVTDGCGANHIHRYNAKGDYLSSWGGKSTAAKEDGKFSTPHKIIIDRRGREPLVLVTDRANHRLQWFTLEGKHVKTLDGTENDFLRLPAVLNIRGSDVAIGDLAGRVTILDKDNNLVTQIGDSGDPKKRATNRIAPDQWVDGQFIAPHGLSWDGKGNLYVSEWMLAGRIVKLKRVKSERFPREASREAVGQFLPSLKRPREMLVTTEYSRDVQSCWRPDACFRRISESAGRFSLVSSFYSDIFFFALYQARCSRGGDQAGRLRLCKVAAPEIYIIESNLQRRNGGVSR